MSSPDSSLKLKVFSGFLWKLGERMGAKLISFVISIVLARILTPDDFGLIAMVTVFISFADIIVLSGFGNALIQKETADELDFSSVFYFSTAVAVLMWAALYFAAPVIADFYRDGQITVILRMMNLRLLISGINSVQSAYAYRNMQYKRFFWSSIGATSVSAAAAIVLAYAGYGVWALVAQYLIGETMSAFILWFTVRWRPTLAYSWKRMKGMFSYGWKLLFSSLIGTAYNEMRSLIIGRLYSSSDLAYYVRGKSFPALVTDNITATIDSVLFPAISKRQKSPEAVKNMMRQSMTTTSYIVWPMMAGLAAVARPLVILLLTEKWLFCVPYLRIACFFNALLPIQNANTQAIKALGRSDVILYLEIGKRIVGVAILLMVMRHGVLIIALSSILTSAIFLLFNTAPNAKLLNYRFTEQMADILPSLGLSLLMAAAVYPMQYLSLPAIAILGIQAFIGLIIYTLLSLIFKVKSLRFIFNIVLQLLRGKDGER